MTSSRTRGLLLTTSGVFLLSPDALFLLWSTADPWTTLFWRGLLLAVGTAIWLQLSGTRLSALWRTPPDFTGLIGILAFASTLVTFPLAIQHTSTANTLIIAACTPMVSALIGYFLLGERIDRTTMLTILACVAGVLMIMRDSIGSGTLAGDLAALAYAVAMAVVLSAIRHQNRPLYGGQLFLMAGLLVAVGTSAMVVPDTLQLERIAVYIPFGLLVLPLALLLIESGPVRLGAAETGLILLLEAVFGPFHVWLLLDQRPSSTTLIAGGFILICLLLHNRFQNQPTES